VPHVIQAEGLLVLTDWKNSILDGQVFSGQNQIDTWMSESAGSVDLSNARVWMRGAQKFAMGHARQNNVVGKTRLARYFGAGVHPSPRDTDDAQHFAVRLRILNRSIRRILLIRQMSSCMPAGVPPRIWILFRCPVLLRNLDHGGLDRLENLQIPGAPAQDAGERHANLIATWLWLLIQQSLGGYQNRRRAVSALRCTEVGEGVLQGMKISFQSETFDSQHVPRVALDSEDQTGQHRLAVQKNRASAALSQLAAVLRSGVAKILAQDLEQSLVRGEGDVNLFAIQSKTNVRCFPRFDRQCDHAKSPPPGKRLARACRSPP
jgi:hypothetical protein